MKKINYYVCPHCGNLVLCTGEASVSCCGRKLEVLEAKKADEAHQLQIETVEDEWYLTTEHPMTKNIIFPLWHLSPGIKYKLLSNIRNGICKCGFPGVDTGSCCGIVQSMGYFISWYKGDRNYGKQ